MTKAKRNTIEVQGRYRHRVAEQPDFISLTDMAKSLR